MSTKTMRLPPRRVLTASSNNKRNKEEAEADGVKQSTAKKQKAAEPSPPRLGSIPPNQLLAGYLAHEFLSKGTLFGEPWDPSASASEPKAEEEEVAEPRPERLQRYVAVADLMSADGSHLAGIVNPAQLARLLQL